MVPSLAYYILESGPVKMESCCGMTTPTSSNEIQHFFGFANFTKE